MRVMGVRGKKRSPIHETAIERLSRQSRERDANTQRGQPLVTPEAEQHGAYQDAWTEIDGGRARVKVNRGGTTIERWLNAPHDDVMGDSERAAIRYCQSLWARIDHKGQTDIRVSGGDGMAEHEALADLATLKLKLPAAYWNLFENVCRFHASANSRQDRVKVAFVAGMIALWRGL